MSGDDNVAAGTISSSLDFQVRIDGQDVDEVHEIAFDLDDIDRSRSLAGSNEFVAELDVLGENGTAILEGCSNVHNVVAAHRKRGSLVVGSIVAAAHVEAEGGRQSLVAVHVVNIAARRAVVVVAVCSGGSNANRVADANISREDCFDLRARPKRILPGDAHAARPAVRDLAISRDVENRNRRGRVLRSQASVAGDRRAIHRGNAARNTNSAVPGNAAEGEFTAAVCNSQDAIATNEAVNAAVAVGLRVTAAATR
mmetsp:Transcript_17540/g.25959  ORF Transcript_17540/g.25959 Transcript_17540/m.25959 type:complete len:255 (-) Transcript_17540:118-882(-)